MAYNLLPYRRPEQDAMTLAIAEAIVQCRNFDALADSHGVPTLAALAQGRPVCWIGSRPKCANGFNKFDFPELNGAEHLQRNPFRRWEDAIGTPGAEDVANDEAQSVEDDESLYEPMASGLCQHSAQQDCTRPETYGTKHNLDVWLDSPIPNAWG